MSSWVFVGLLIVIAAMVSAVLIVATRAFLDTRAAGNDIDRNPDGKSYGIVGGIRRGWINYTWPGGELQVSDPGVVLSGPGFRLQARWDAVNSVQMLRTLVGWGVRFQIDAERRPLTFWVLQRRYAEKVLATARSHGVTIRPPTRFSI